MSLKKLTKKTYKYFKDNPSTILAIGIIALAFFLRIYDINGKSPFGWDQIDNAWAAKNIIVDQNFPLLGMQAKLNSGVFIGPFYYYLVALFYFFTGLDPVASGILAAFTSLFSLFVIYFVAKALFSKGVGIIAVLINGFSFLVIIMERVQWPVNFVPVIGLLIFFSLYQILRGKTKYILLLALSFGVSLHIHFTFVYYPIIVLLTLPFFSKSKETLKHIGWGALILVPFVLPMIIAFTNTIQSASNITSYGSSFYHGLHLTRVMQLTSDAFIQFDPYLRYEQIKFLKFILVPIFFAVLLFKNITKEKLIICYLTILYFVVPWIVISTYSGTITNYYFDISRYLAVIIISYLIYRVFTIKKIFIKSLIIFLLLVYSFINVKEFVQYNKKDSLEKYRKKAQEKIDRGVRIEFQEGVPESYLYYYYMRKKGKEVY